MKPNDKAIEAARKVVIQRATHNSFNPSFLFGVIEAALDAAYAAQFQSKDYAGLVERLRREPERDVAGHKSDACLAADALEAVLAEREAWKGRQEATAAILKQVETERAELATLLAPVDDDMLREIAAMHFAGIDGHSDDWDRYVDEAKNYIDAIRPHIEAAERERCAKIAEGSFYFDIETCLNSTKKEMTAHVAKAIAAAIRSGK